MHRAYTRLWLQNKKKNVRVRSFQELDLDPGVAVGARVAQNCQVVACFHDTKRKGGMRKK